MRAFLAALAAFFDGLANVLEFIANACAFLARLGLALIGGALGLLLLYGVFYAAFLAPAS